MAATALAAVPAWAQERAALASRLIPGSEESLAIVGLGNSQAFRNGDVEASRQLLEIFLEHGGNYVDVGGRSVTTVGQVGQELGASEQLFLATYLEPGDPEAMTQQAIAFAATQGKTTLDLVHTRELAGFRANHAAYRRLKSEGHTRHYGVARIGPDAQLAMIGLIEDGLVDFIQVNYSMLEPEAGDRLLPLALDNGVAVAISRPFINGNYFDVVRGYELPEWAADFDCETWAQFSLKFILSNPAVTCVLTETANPRHAVDNLGAGVGRLPDESTRRRMLEHLRSLV